MAVYVSAATAWELSTKSRIGKWPDADNLVARLAQVVEANDFTPLPITIEHGRFAGSMPGSHKDPFDRILAAQAKIEDMTLVTADPAFETFGTRILW